MRLCARLAGAAMALWMAGGVAAQERERAMIVLDASGSMWGQVEGKSKIEIARDTLASVLGAVPEQNELGLLVYGHRRKGDCSDIELAVPPAPGTAGAISEFANRINPKGKTPLSAAVGQAAEALRYTEDKATVILVTDGLETCEMDPCALGRELESLGVDFTAHVVGFGLSEDEGAQVACLAEETGGRYLEASGAEALADALTRTVVAAAPPEPEPEPEPAPPAFNLRATASLSEGGPDMDGGLRWDLYPIEDGAVAKRPLERKRQGVFEVSAPEGDYELLLRAGQIERRLRLALSEDEAIEPHVVLDAGYLTVRPMRKEGGDVDGSIRVDVEAREDVTVKGRGERRFLLPAGPVHVHARQAKARAEVEAEVVAGEARRVDIVVGSGVLYPTALYAEGGPPVETSIRFDVLGAEADIAGKRERWGRVRGTRVLDLPAGEYILNARLQGAEVQSEPFTIRPGARTEVEVILSAGVVAITAPGARRLDILGPPDIRGERDRIERGRGEEMLYTLPQGRYVVRVEYPDDRAPSETEFEVTAGQRVDVTVQ